MTGAVMIQTTAGSADEAERIAEALVAEGLAACVQIAAIRSRYVWKGAVQREDEHLLLVKTRAELFEAVRARIRGLHSYEAPEIVAGSRRRRRSRLPGLAVRGLRRRALTEGR